MIHCYLSDPKVFADLFNFHFYQGRQVIDADQLVELDPGAVDWVSLVGKGERVCGMRDVLKGVVAKQNHGQVLMLMGIESQSYIDYAMPLRVMGYDYLQYRKQQSALGRQARESRRWGNGAEFLSRFSRQDRLIPVTTLVVYLGSTPWDGPTDLWGMMDMSGVADRRLVQNYGINLLQPCCIEDSAMERFHTDMQLLMPLFKRGDDYEAVMRILRTDERYQKMRPLTAAVYGAVSGRKIEIPVDRKEENVNMLMAMENLFQAGVKKGRTEGRTEGLAEGEAKGLAEGLVRGKGELLNKYIWAERENKMSDEQILSQLQRLFQLSPEDARKYLV